MRMAELMGVSDMALSSGVRRDIVEMDEVDDLRSRVAELETTFKI